WIKGFSRKLSRNLLFPVKLFVSVVQSVIINMGFRPKVAIGSGGYAAGPAIFGASVMGAKIILLEQNSYPGITTRLLERYADEVHISFEDSRKYLKREKIIYTTGNPVRKNLGSVQKEKALQKFGLNADKKTLLILGGSLGAASINKAVAENVKKLEAEGIQVIWQAGKYYYDEYKQFNTENVKVFEFIDDMNSAYSACDLLLARAGATTIAEVLVLGIPSVLVPSPNVAENHQYYNAKSLADKNAAVLIEDEKISRELFTTVTTLVLSQEKLAGLKSNALKLAKPDAAKVIAERAIKYMEAV
ncbi:MAG TPA: UDP-N-acetylglucosamine--N-acetylmuramyl-(pentapeptide) pyrophosphoryl-undecaprenol N-acetylglucosamine transferase, partial [Ignavibacteriales bacterium]|nr:UDP-N-acetylglucosamine--N-acetylmuramyl-(pentapeptide) pyrophosphoryl-undecaprenol N-acetylglucosamine transferase [Ignavibacteriales bacterium]